MSPQVDITKAALADLRSIGDYTQKIWGPAQRRDYLALIRERFELLAQSPDMGLRHDMLSAGLLSASAGRHIFFYRKTVAGIRIIRVLHQSMDFRRHLTR